MKLLVIRFSALGDVAMSVPVIDSLARQHPELSITMLSKGFVEPLFAHMPDNVKFQGVNLNDYKGLGGLYRLFKTLQKERFDAIADIHDVLRTKILRLFFWMAGVKIAHIDKGRSEKKALCHTKNKRFKQLKTSFQRYSDVFETLGWHVEPRFHSIFGTRKGDDCLFSGLADSSEKKRWIGIAPFAAHIGKVLPFEMTSDIISQLSQDEDNHLFLFGGGAQEKELLNKLAKGKERVTVVAGKLKLAGELALMSHLDVMVSMDSANMHLASLTGIPVVSVWGATHPYAGFMGWKQKEENAVQATLDCRPCSIFGNKPCHRGDYACLHQLATSEIIAKIYSVIPCEP